MVANMIFPQISSSPSINSFIASNPFLSMLETQCVNMRDFQIVHAQIIKRGLAKDVIATSRLLAFCASHRGNITYAYRLFSATPNPNLFMWNTIIRAFSQSQSPHHALSLFIDMLSNSPIQPHSLTYPSVFKAFSQLGLANDGKQLHGRIAKLGLLLDPYTSNAILHMYSSCGFLHEAKMIFQRIPNPDTPARNILLSCEARFGDVAKARKMFDEMPERTLVTWNSMISGYVRVHKFREAIILFNKMQSKGIEPDEYTIASVLNSCGSTGALTQGEWLHNFILQNNIKMNSIVITALVNMYSKCGCIEKASQVFESCKTKPQSAHNAMIIGLAMNGEEHKAMAIFENLKKPDKVSFLGALMACGNVGMIERAKQLFYSMKEVHALDPTVEHYSCMVDALGRAARVEEAEEVARGMEVERDSILWGALLYWSRKHGSAEVAENAAFHGGDIAVNRRGVSAVEVDGEFHEFVAGDETHPLKVSIYELLCG